MRAVWPDFMTILSLFAQLLKVLVVIEPVQNKNVALSHGAAVGCRMQLQGMEATEILHSARAAERKAISSAGSVLSVASSGLMVLGTAR